MEYEFRVTAVNLSGAGECSIPSEFVFARDPKSTFFLWSSLILLTFMILLHTGLIVWCYVTF